MSHDQTSPDAYQMFFVYCMFTNIDTEQRLLFQIRDFCHASNITKPTMAVAQVEDIYIIPL